MRVELSHFMESDIEEIADWIAQDSPRRAISFIRQIREELRRIAEGPHRYQLRPEIGEAARCAIVGRYVILFCIDGPVVRVERIVYGGRDLPGLFP